MYKKDQIERITQLITLIENRKKEGPAPEPVMFNQYV